MRLTRTKKIGLAVATAWPPLYMLFFFVTVAVSFASFGSHRSANGIPTLFMVILFSESQLAAVRSSASD